MKVETTDSKITLIRYPCVGRSLLIYMLCEYGDITVETLVKQCDYKTDHQRVLPIVKTCSNELLYGPRYASVILPTNHTATRRLAKELYLLADYGPERAQVDYIVGICNVDLGIILTGYLKTQPFLPDFRKARLDAALGNIEANLRQDGRLFEDKITLAEFAIFEVFLWLSGVFPRKMLKQYKRIWSCVEVVRTLPKMSDFFDTFMNDLENDKFAEIEDMKKIATELFPEIKREIPTRSEFYRWSRTAFNSHMM